MKAPAVESEERKALREITGYTPDALPKDGGTEALKDQKLRATAQWLDAIIELEALQRDQAALADDIRTGVRIEQKQAREIISKAMNMAQGTERNTRQNAIAMEPALYSWIDTLGEAIERCLFWNISDAVYKVAVEIAGKASGRAEALVNESGGLKRWSRVNDIYASIDESEEGEKIESYILRMAALLDQLPVMPEGELGATAQWLRRVESMTLEELNHELAEKEKELEARSMALDQLCRELAEKEKELEAPAPG